MAHYYCGECRLFDDDPSHHIYHCDACGICRVGRGLGIDFFHCHRCRACLSIELERSGHRCIERTLDSNCPICGEYLFTSTQQVILMKPCQHSIHARCYRQHTARSYQCPICCKSLGDMSAFFRELDATLAAHRMPAEYAAHRSNVFCNDCERRSWRPFHFVYHRCGHCSSYNTVVLETRQDGGAAAADGDAVTDGEQQQVQTPVNQAALTQAAADERLPETLSDVLGDTTDSDEAEDAIDDDDDGWEDEDEENYDDDVDDDEQWIDATDDDDDPPQPPADAESLRHRVSALEVQPRTASSGNNPVERLLQRYDRETAAAAVPPSAASRTASTARTAVPQLLQIRLPDRPADE